jgi:2-oxoglutarate ferredoxin oxidoreductase subunit alpha
MDKVDKVASSLWRWEDAGDRDAEVVLVAYGSTARTAKRAMLALQAEGHKLRLIRPVTIWPFFGPVLTEAARGRKLFVVLEQNAGQLSLEVERAVAGQARVKHIGKLDGEMMNPDEVAAELREVMRHV